MRKIYKDEEYIIYVKDILDNNEYKKLKNYKHHGITRYDHCIRVSYNSYKIAKKLKLSSLEVERAGLLHDFFLVNNQKISKFDRFKVLFTHPKLALEKSKNQFILNKKEMNIIKSHMFPFGFTFPEYKESILVNIVDNISFIYEITNASILFIVNFIKKIKIKKSIISK